MKSLRAAVALSSALACSNCVDPQAPNPVASQNGQPAPGPQAAPPVDAAARITAAQLAAPPASMRAVPGATFGGGAIRYLGFEVTPEKPQAGAVMRLTHYWQVVKPISGDWTIFVHLELPGTPGVVGNGDHIALGGAYPTSQWRPGTLFRDDELMRLPAQLPTQGLDLYVGLYQGDARLPLDQPALGADNRLKAGNIAFGAAPDQTALPVYKASRATGPITIDGKLDEPDWKKATPVTLVRSMDGAPTKLHTEAKLLWDDKNVYVAFTCQDPDIWSNYTQHDDKLYEGEVVELFVDADGDGKTYNEMEISPANVTFDAYFATRRSDLAKAMTWESGMKTAVTVDGTLNDPKDVDRSWIAEAAIPIAKLAAVPHVPPLVGDRWRINLYRLDIDRTHNQSEGSAFSPLYMGDFHNLPRFGWLEFTK